jgi:hypothetical protein
MPILDFDMGLAQRVGDIYSSPGVVVEYMPEELFERKRIVDKLEKKETFSFISFWRSGFTFDSDRWSPGDMFPQYQQVGHYNDSTKKTATLYDLFPVKFDYSFIFWDTKREQLDFYIAYLFKSIYKSPITIVNATDTVGLQMRCYMDFDYKLKVSDEYVLEKEDKVPYFKGKFDIKLEGWLYDTDNVSNMIEYVHTFSYNQHNFYFGDLWVPYPDSGYASGESGEPGENSGEEEDESQLPSGSLPPSKDAVDVEVSLI